MPEQSKPEQWQIEHMEEEEAYTLLGINYPTAKEEALLRSNSSTPQDGIQAKTQRKMPHRKE